MASGCTAMLRTTHNHPRTTDKNTHREKPVRRSAATGPTPAISRRERAEKERAPPLHDNPKARHARQYRRVVVTHARLAGSQSASCAWLWAPVNGQQRPALLERKDGTLVTWYYCLYAPRTGGAYDGHHRTAGVAGRTRRRGRRLAASGARAA